MNGEQSQLNRKRKHSGDDVEEFDEIVINAGEGLMMILHSNGHLELKATKDKHYPDIHANCYAPAELKDVKLLHGGGSGSAVFGGYHPDLESIVMKHAGPKDANEVFSLAQISRELANRGENDASAANSMQSRIPRFTMAYISCYHVRHRKDEPWNSLRTVSYSSFGTRLSFGRSVSFGSNNSDTSTSCIPVLQNVVDYNGGDLNCGDESIQHKPRRLIISNRPSGNGEQIYVDSTTIYFNLPYTKTEDGVRVIEEGESFLNLFSKVLIKELESHSWKFTIAQRLIGGANPQNGADIFTSGRLHGPLLDKLLAEFSNVMKDLDCLVLPGERQGHYDEILSEMQIVRDIEDVRGVSNQLDSFTGNAIRKNFHPVHGRLPRLRMIGEEFRGGDLALLDPERVPAFFLGKLLKPGYEACNVFPGITPISSALDSIGTTASWMSILEQATQFEADDKVVVERIWTCGLTDAGLHNTFLSMERGLEVFDLGEPSLKPRPAFLTKFLMSFFHTLGMESDTNGSWKNRFVVETENDQARALSLTPETRKMLDYCYSSFEKTIEHFMKIIFRNDNRVKRLLLTYVVLQLLSDASFCLQRWESKGGGTKRYGESLKQPLEKWLWRSIWDLFISSCVYTKYLGGPSCTKRSR